MGKTLSEIQSLMSPEQESNLDWWERVDCPPFCYKRRETGTMAEAPPAAVAHITLEEDNTRESPPDLNM